VALLLLVIVAGVLLSNPRPRASDVRSPTEARTSSAAPSALPMLATSPAPARPVRGAAGSTRPATAVPAVRVPVPEQGRVRVPIVDAVPAHLPASGVPLGWELKEFTGDASVELVRSDGRVALRLRSERTSFALHRDLVLDLRQYPMLAWSWKVTRLPAGGDVRDAARDDQAAQVYVIFPRWPSPPTASDVIGYVWDSRAPVGTTLPHPRAANVRIIVVESGTAHLGTWARAVRNVAEDYRSLFGRQPPRVGKVALMIDSNDTRGRAEALFGDLTFFRPGLVRSEIVVPMLR
jgi:hypothetical protein